jgi:hypothetical protein
MVAFGATAAHRRLHPAFADFVDLVVPELQKRGPTRLFSEQPPPFQVRDHFDKRYSGLRGTEGSNPLPSSSESSANLTFGGASTTR